MVKKQTSFELVEITKIKNKEKLMGELQGELKEEYRARVKSKIKQKIKEIAMTKDLVTKQEAELEEMLSGKNPVIGKEEYLFG